MGRREIMVGEGYPSAPGATTVLVVDDQRTFADAVALALGQEEGVHCLGTAGGVDEALVLVRRLRPDVVVLDVNLADGNGVAATPLLLAVSPDTRVVVLSGFITQQVLRDAVSAGASAVLPKDGRIEQLLNAIRTASRDRFIVAPELVRDLMTVRHHGSTGEENQLTAREIEVLKCLARGIDAQQTAQSMGISLLTCRGYIKSILMKLGAHSQLEAVVMAHRSGLIDIGGEA